MAELRNISWKRLIHDALFSEMGRKILWRSRSPQWALTYALRQQGMVILDDPDILLEYKGLTWAYDTLNYPRIFEAEARYDFSKLKKTDYVLDMGANIGSYALQVALIVDQVVAVEPLFYHLLEKNINLNGLETKVELFKGAIGTDVVDCQEVRGVAQIIPVPRKAFTVVRMDIGGAEWNISPYAVLQSNVRHFEGEFHFWEKDEWQKECFDEWIKALKSFELKPIIRWSKHKHWAYVKADKDYTEEERQLKDGSFRGETRNIWSA